MSYVIDPHLQQQQVYLETQPPSQTIYYVEAPIVQAQSTVLYQLPPSTSNSPTRNVVIPPGTYVPGTSLQVGSHSVVIERYLSEGGFAHVYVVQLDPIDGDTDRAVLKRVAVPDKENLNLLRKEVDTMKRLRGFPNVVRYIDSHASHLTSGGYEVFVLMEFCSGGGLINLMNSRLQHRFTEREILYIFSDIVVGVSAMHYLEPPLIHRDLKIENVLIDGTGVFKVCDFGSSSEVIEPGRTGQECRLIEDDIQQHTTLQYRSPEMVDVYRRLPIDEKSDIWALGVLLYKLCYYTTPFEDKGQLAILNATFSFPSAPAYSDRIKYLISEMLRESPRKRPNIYGVCKEVSRMRKVNVPIQNKYIAESGSVASSFPQQGLHSNIVRDVSNNAKSNVSSSVPDVKPMRRGRLPAPNKSQSRASITNSSQNSKRNSITSLSEESGYPSYLPPPSPKEDIPGPRDILAAQRSMDSRFPPIAIEELDNTSPQKNNISDSLSVLQQPQPKRPVLMNSGEISSKREFSDGSQIPIPGADKRSTTPMGSRHNSLSDNSSIRAHSRASSRKPSADITGSRSNFLFSRPQSSSGRRSRPVSMIFDSSVDFLRSLSNGGRSVSPTGSTASAVDNTATSMNPSLTGQSERSEHIESNMEFLKSLDTGNSVSDGRGSTQMKYHYSGQYPNTSSPTRSISNGSNGGRHSRRASMQMINHHFSGTKNKLSGKFGEAFRKFEQVSQPSHEADLVEVTENDDRKRESVKLRYRDEGKHDRSISSPEKSSDIKDNSAAFHLSRPSSKLFHRNSSATKQMRPLQNASVFASATVSKHEDVPHVWDSMERLAAARPKMEYSKMSIELTESTPKDSDFEKMPPPVIPIHNMSHPISKISNSTSTSSSEITPKYEDTLNEPLSSHSRKPSIQNRVQSLLAQSQTIDIPRSASGYGKYTDKVVDSDDEVKLDGGDSSHSDQADGRALLLSPKISPKKSLLSSTESRSIHRSASASLVTESPDKAISGKPAPPPKPINLQTSSLSPRNLQNHYSPGLRRNAAKQNFVHDDLDHEEEWETSFAKRFPRIPGLDDSSDYYLDDADLKKLTIEEKSR
ncbi:uncharacterized protein V1516DRAFT_682374 [Lipomyces oligophaga]|uniref:uncharacterized protein n=1 Tax=Lipomyces oligophaga TaxID=45792 RepID=UPI0034CF4AF6